MSVPHQQDMLAIELFYLDMYNIPSLVALLLYAEFKPST